jgi:hypothetical protein
MMKLCNVICTEFGKRGKRIWAIDRNNFLGYESILAQAIMSEGLGLGTNIGLRIADGLSRIGYPR